jgi:electron transport complex protein RnfE
MGLASMAVLLGSNIVVSLVKNMIPEKVRIPSYIVIIASFVTIIDLTMQAFVPALHGQLGIFIPLIVVNCLILGRAEAFASKSTILPSIIDAVGMGVGFTYALVILGAIREILGSGSIFGAQIIPEGGNILIFVMPPGAFLALGFLIAAVNVITRKYEAWSSARAHRSAPEPTTAAAAGGK